MEQLEPLFTGRDLELIESLVYDPVLSPSFDIMRGALIWADEWPNGLTSDGLDNLFSLIAARSFLHRGLDFSKFKLAPDRFRLIWESAQQQGFRWPGFKRLTLSDTDKAYYEHQLKEAAEEKDF
jgi:hypothetical protein